MKNFLSAAIFITVFFMTNLNHSQWSNDFRLTNNTGSSLTSENAARCIAVFGNLIHTIWYDNRDGNYEIYYKRSTNNGQSWEAVQRLTNDPALSDQPSIVAYGMRVHVVWQDLRNGNFEIYHKRSTDGGATWSSDDRLTTNQGYSNAPVIGLNGSSIVHVIWMDDRDGNFEIYHKKSIDGGVNWEPVTRITNNPSVSEIPSMSISAGGFLHVTWQDNRDGNYEIYYSRSTNDGTSFEPDIRITSNAGQSKKPTISSSGSNVHIAWVDDKDGNNEIYHKRSTDNGINWSVLNRITNDPYNSDNPSIIASLQFAHIVWYDERNTPNGDIYYDYSTNSGNTWINIERLTNDVSISNRPHITVYGSALHMVWYDNRDNDNEIYYKYNLTGNPVGINNISSEIPRSFLLKQNYPNPFNPVTNISFSIPKQGLVKLAVYDAAGKVAAVLFNGELSAGTYNYDFDAGSLSSGVYFCKLESGDFSQTKKMVLIK